MKLWIWNWQEGGYNVCKTDNREAAIKEAHRMSVGLRLHVDESSVHEGSPEELQKLDERFASLFH